MLSVCDNLVKEEQTLDNLAQIEQMTVSDYELDLFKSLSKQERTLGHLKDVQRIRHVDDDRYQMFSEFPEEDRTFENLEEVGDSLLVKPPLIKAFRSLPESDRTFTNFTYVNNDKHVDGRFELFNVLPKSEKTFENLKMIADIPPHIPPRVAQNFLALPQEERSAEGLKKSCEAHYRDRMESMVAKTLKVEDSSMFSKVKGAFTYHVLGRNKDGSSRDKGR